MKYYAEYNTDKIIREKYFPNFEYKGVLIEVGGATPEFLSMSKHFKDNGWRTIIIEPNPNFAKQHREVGNEVYEMACSYEDKKNVDFTIVEQNVHAYSGIITDHSFSSLEIKEEYITKTGVNLNNLSTKKIIVDVTRLETLLDSIEIKKVDILSIDVEGWEIEVMMGLNISKVKCDIVVLENLFHNESYNDYMKSIGFNLLEKIEYNYVYKFSNW
jgi:FkbM family methyltransferase